MLFVAVDYPELPMHLEIFNDKSNLNERLDFIAKEYINNTMCFDDYNGEVTFTLIIACIA